MDDDKPKSLGMHMIITSRAGSMFDVLPAFFLLISWVMISPSELSQPPGPE